MHKCGNSIMAITHVNLIMRNCNLRAYKVDNNKYKCESHGVKFCKIINHLLFIRNVEILGMFRY